MNRPNYLHLRLRALARASAASWLATRQRLAGNHYLADRAAILADCRREEANFLAALA